MLYLWIAAGAAAIGIIVFTMWLSKKSSEKEQAPRYVGDNVVPFRRKGSKCKPSGQKCSFCGKEELLTFYAGDNGAVKGVCKHCKPKAERRDMLPL
ncbi:hypothetical protein OIN60_08065 [Paenibacillus sp. P96]|uniref:Uncharacterized protein n=1 Tax=Paenibacillus zeirhizosphaerae TaxID=2987519 RepID=A0ABT9FQ25_9BACL|nr:hypothetical protein [Paenibacillus sp. P96]MDP4096725.1 hypothetical protein [Paenibacillus sp. P96]